MESLFEYLFVLCIAAISFVLFLLILSESYKLTSIVLHQTINALRLVFETKVMIENYNWLFFVKDVNYVEGENSTICYKIYIKRWYYLKFKYLGLTNCKHTKDFYITSLLN